MPGSQRQRQEGSRVELTKQHSAEAKIRIVLEGLRGEDSICLILAQLWALMTHILRLLLRAIASDTAAARPADPWRALAA